MSDLLRAAEARLFARHRFGVKLGLHVEEDLLRRLGNPERCCPVVHVAGTNGKGSVCAVVEAVLRAMGFTTGFYSSPHLVRFNERFRVNGEPASDAELKALIQVVEATAEQTAGATGQEATFFECATAMAFEHFRRSSVNIAVIETGMGGRLDATNVVDPLVSVITRIDVEHTAYLGDTLAAIAAEKAGIIKPGRPVVCGAMDPEAEAVVVEVARERGAPLCLADRHVSVARASVSLSGQRVRVETAELPYGVLDFPLVGIHQQENLATAVATIEAVLQALDLPLNAGVVKRGIAATEWPGRFQVLRSTPPVILDGAHNPAGASALAKGLRQIFPDARLGLVVGLCDDKDARAILKPLLELTDRLWAVAIRSERSVPRGRIVSLVGGAGCEARDAELTEAVKEALTWAEDAGGVVCIAGSLYLVGEVLSRRDELGL